MNDNHQPPGLPRFHETNIGPLFETIRKRLIPLNLTREAYTMTHASGTFVDPADGQEYRLVLVPAQVNLALVGLQDTQNEIVQP